MSYLEITDPARCAYASLAPYYDRFTAEYAYGADRFSAEYVYDSWLQQIEARALALGLSGWRALDVGCGTGRSFAPLLARGYQVSACDLSPEMIDEARRKFPGHVEDLLVADMRDLPDLGVFDLVTCIDDTINYLLCHEDLVAAFQSVARLLAPGGVYAFDVNSLKTYRTVFTQTAVREDPSGLFCWRGECAAPIEAGDAASATIEAFIEADDALWLRVTSRHVQRHHPPAAIHDALRAAGLECAAVAGQRPGCRLEDHADESEHIKVVYFVRRRRIGRR